MKIEILKTLNPNMSGTQSDISIEILQKSSQQAIQDKEAPMYCKNGRSVIRIRKGYIDSGSTLTTNDDLWFYIDPI